ncbi:hypothetical protein AB0M23_25115 [Streptomyces sp. NPDC052077]
MSTRSSRTSPAAAWSFSSSQPRSFRTPSHVWSMWHVSTYLLQQRAAER